MDLQAQRDLLPLLLVFNNQNYLRYLTTHHIELTNLLLKNPSAYKDLQICGIGASLSGKKFSTTPEDLMTKVTINSEVEFCRRPVRGYSNNFDAENNFLLNSDILAELQKELKNKIR